MNPIFASIIFELEQKLNRKIQLKSYSSVSGGDINKAFCINTNKGQFFVKINSSCNAKQMFDAEAKGLQILKDNSCFSVPNPLLVGSKNGDSFFVMSYLERGSESVNFWEDFAKCLAEMHETSSSYFGLGSNNFIGTLKQQNTPTKTWKNFL